MSDDLREKVARALDAKLAEVGGAYLSNDQATDAILNLIGGDGWKLVPVEATREMLKAASAYEDQCAIHNYGGSPDSEGVWGAMIAASPPPPVTP